jgi:hypothetical protein
MGVSVGVGVDVGATVDVGTGVGDKNTVGANKTGVGNDDGAAQAASTILRNRKPTTNCLFLCVSVFILPG